MEHLIIPDGYRPRLTSGETQRAITLIHDEFPRQLAARLNLRKIRAPLFVDRASGLTDAPGAGNPVAFDIPDIDAQAEVVQSLSKWARLALKRYDFKLGTGLYASVHTIRPDVHTDNLRSVYVEQWDWEKRIDPQNRETQYLRDTVRDVVTCVCDAAEVVRKAFPALSFRPDRDVYFITAQELEDRFPHLTPAERETEICRLHRTVFLTNVGPALNSGAPHAGRAPDCDDWDLNGTLFMWHPILKRACELSAMGIRADADALRRQLAAAGCKDRRFLLFHQMLLNGDLPQSIGGSIGASRMCMLLLEMCHIGEAQVGLWDADTIRACEEAEIPLL
ncbi:MAG: aspartate--ammonia ligase [Oscillibacter sp.]|nr:aspartate--ammonia ligase [Oscillibacter sp.]